MRRTLFFVGAILTGIAVAVAWAWMVSNPIPTRTVPDGATQTINGITWHLDFMTEVSLDDPALAETSVDDIEGATYILAQYTYSTSESTMVCSGNLLGDDRDWASTLVTPTSPGLTRACQDQTSATSQMVFTIPSSAVSEVRGLELTPLGVVIILSGQVH